MQGYHTIVFVLSLDRFGGQIMKSILKLADGAHRQEHSKAVPELVKLIGRGTNKTARTFKPCKDFMNTTTTEEHPP